MLKHKASIKLPKNIFIILLSLTLPFGEKSMAEKGNMGKSTVTNNATTNAGPGGGEIDNLYQLANEKLIFSFQTKNKSLLTICIDKNEKYIVYRYGTQSEVALEYPSKKEKNSFGKFTYSGWERHGGVQNEGMNLSYLAFSNNQYKYVVYDTYHAVGDLKSTGVKVINTTTGKTIDIQGVYESIKGSLLELRFNDKIIKADELYD